MLIIKKLLLSIYFTFTSLLISIILVVNFTPLYSLSIKLFNLSAITHLSQKQLMNDYLTIIKYLQFPWIKKLELNYFPMSANGEFHFFEVKKIFLFIYLLFILCIILGAIFYLFYKKNLFNELLMGLNYFFYLSVSLIIVLISSFYLNFSIVFDTFHKLFFNNDYWLFNPSSDPVINALPENFFMLCALTIISITLLFSILGKVLYNKFAKI